MGHAKASVEQIKAVNKFASDLEILKALKLTRCHCTVLITISFSLLTVIKEQTPYSLTVKRAVLGVCLYAL